MPAPPVRYAESWAPEKRRRIRVLTMAWMLVAAFCVLCALSLF